MEQLKLKALTYIRKVTEVFDDGGSDKPRKFVKLLRDFSTRKIDAEVVAEKVKRLFKGHDDLILEFNDFLPEGCKIIIVPDDNKETEEVEFQQAMASSSSSTSSDLVKLDRANEAVGSSAEVKISKSKALAYLSRVLIKTDSTDKPRKFVSRLKLLGDHNDLILEINNEFFPEDNKITIDEGNKQTEEKEFQESVSLINKVKLQFPGNQKVMKSLEDILIRLPDGEPFKLYEEFAVIFNGHDDLIDDFHKRYVIKSDDNQINVIDQNRDPEDGGKFENRKCKPSLTSNRSKFSLANLKRNRFDVNRVSADVSDKEYEREYGRNNSSSKRVKKSKFM